MVPTILWVAPAATAYLRWVYMGRQLPEVGTKEIISLRSDSAFPQTHPCNMTEPCRRFIQLGSTLSPFLEADSVSKAVILNALVFAVEGVKAGEQHGTFIVVRRNQPLV